MKRLIYNFFVWLFLALPARVFAQTREFEEFGGVAEGCARYFFSFGPLKFWCLEPISDVATIKGIEAIFSNIVAIALAVAGIALFIMLTVGGFKYLTSGGDQQATQSARQTLTYAFFGFVILVAAFLILRFISEFTGVDVTGFSIRTD